MITLIHLGLLMHLFVANPQLDPAKFIRIERLSPNVAIAYWPGIDRRCNLTVIQSQKGLVIIDTEASPRLMAPMKEKIEKMFGRNDWAYVINTHAHDNHCSGNCLFKGAVIVGHENLPEDMQWLIRRQTEPEWRRKEIDRYNAILRDLRTALPQSVNNRVYNRLIRSDLIFYELFVKDLEDGYEVVKPSLMFTDRHTLDMGDLTLELIFFGKGHSLSDILVYIPQEKVLVTGAIAYQRGFLPEIGEQSQLQDVHRFLAVLDSLLADNVKINHVIPSHSALLQRSDLPPIRDYYQRMLTAVQVARQQGLTLEQTIARLTVGANFPAFRESPPGSYGYCFQERNIRNLWRILSEEQPQPQGQNVQP
jgi:glyoxylase-like metal-dependent hydrolase (beta-lactamase superfamily II)